VGTSYGFLGKPMVSPPLSAFSLYKWYEYLFGPAQLSLRITPLPDRVWRKRNASYHCVYYPP